MEFTRFRNINQTIEEKTVSEILLLEFLLYLNIGGRLNVFIQFIEI